ncbi:MAG: hypothetical protein ACYC3X_10225 [Pirellulaceae bacterium]
MAKTKIETDELDAITWIEFNTMAISLDPNDSKTYYMREDGIPYRMSWDRSRKSLLDLLVDMIEPYAGWSPKMMAFFPRDGRESLSAAVGDMFAS